MFFRRARVFREGEVSQTVGKVVDGEGRSVWDSERERREENN